MHQGLAWQIFGILWLAYGKQHDAYLVKVLAYGKQHDAYLVKVNQVQFSMIMCMHMPLFPLCSCNMDGDTFGISQPSLYMYFVSMLPMCMYEF